MEEVPPGSSSQFSANGDLSGSRVMRIYVDGSCEDNQNVSPSTKAGWGFCVIEGDDGDIEIYSGYKFYKGDVK